MAEQDLLNPHEPTFCIAGAVDQEGHTIPMFRLMRVVTVNGIGTIKEIAPLIYDVIDAGSHAESTDGIPLWYIDDQDLPLAELSSKFRKENIPIHWEWTNPPDSTPFWNALVNASKDIRRHLRFRPLTGREQLDEHLDDRAAREAERVEDATTVGGQETQIGRLMLEYRDVIREIRALRVEVRSTMGNFKDLSEGFRHAADPFPDVASAIDGFYVTVDRDGDRDPMRVRITFDELDVQRLHRRVDQLTELMSRKASLDARLTGMDLKDSVVDF